MFDLCIGIVYHNKTANNIYNLIKSIKQNINIIGTYQIILFDNCENNKDISVIHSKLKSLENVEVIFELLNGQPHNWYQFEARKQIIKKANSKYIWFVDSDDTVLPFSYDFTKETSDIITFRFNASAGFRNCWWTLDKCPIYWNKIDYKKVYSYLNVMLWNKWIKTSILKEGLPLLTEDKLEIVGGEDSLFNFISWKNGKTVKFLKDITPYYYNTLDSLSAKERYHNLKVLKHLLIGQKDFIRLTYNIFTVEDLLTLGFKPIEESFSYYISRANRYTIWKRILAYKIVQNAFGKETSEKLICTSFVIFRIGEYNGLNSFLLRCVFKNYISEKKIDKFIGSHIDEIVSMGSISNCWEKYYGK